MLKRGIQKIFDYLGYSINKKDQINITNDIREDEFWEILELCKPYTMTSIERMYALYNSVHYIIANNIEGCFVECGVWRGGSSMLVAKMLQNRNITSRKIILYDTFEGMSVPTQYDLDYRGKTASELLKADNAESIRCFADIKDVTKNMKLTNYPDENIVYITGKVEDTLPAESPDNPIALLRLDTDWFESTYHELVHLYPKVTKNGVLIIDDYGHWEGCRKATNQYFQKKNISILLNRIDYTGRIGIKI